MFFGHGDLIMKPVYILRIKSMNDRSLLDYQYISICFIGASASGGSFLGPGNINAPGGGGAASLFGGEGGGAGGGMGNLNLLILME